jgi:hypothetical protein
MAVKLKIRLQKVGFYFKIILYTTPVIGCNDHNLIFSVKQNDAMVTQFFSSKN